MVELRKSYEAIKQLWMSVCVLSRTLVVVDIVKWKTTQRGGGAFLRQNTFDVVRKTTSIL